MIAGITSALSGLQANQLAFDASANNLANLATPGYQALRVNQNAVGDGGVSASLSTDTATSAPLEQTGNSTDLAIAGQGSFQIQDSTGNITTTRNGSFLQDAQGYLRTADGGYVLGTSGPLQAPAGSTFSVAANGAVTAQSPGGGSTSLGTLSLINNGTVGTPATNGLGTIVSGAVELSNVDPVTEAVNSIVARAGYVANLKSIEVSNEMLKKTYQML